MPLNTLHPTPWKLVPEVTIATGESVGMCVEDARGHRVFMLRGSKRAGRYYGYIPENQTFQEEQLLRYIVAAVNEYGTLAQAGPEHRAHNPTVAGSNPASPTKKPTEAKKGSLAPSSDQGPMTSVTCIYCKKPQELKSAGVRSNEKYLPPHPHPELKNDLCKGSWDPVGIHAR